MAKRVLFVCVHNSGRSQMAEAFAHRLSSGSVDVESAGTMPSDSVSVVVIEAMRERGIDISRSALKLLTQEMVDRADRVITMGCSIDEACSAARVPTDDWGLDDPAGRPVEEVRETRDLIEERVGRLLAECMNRLPGEGPSSSAMP